MKKQRKRRQPAAGEYRWDERRLAECVRKFRGVTGKKPTHAFSSPGRTELGGNHTDHNRGKVLAASVDLDSLAVVAPRSDDTIRIFSEGFADPFVLQAGDHAIRREERGTSAALIRGIAAAVVERGFSAGGFDAWVTSRVGIGSGLSSSASFEVLVGAILNALHNREKIPGIQLALAGQSAENNYFGKPCGLMDQLTCSLGGTIKIDFRDPVKPNISRLVFDPRKYGFDLVVVHTGTSHQDLHAEYAAVPEEMRSVARFLGGEHCRDIEVDLFFDRLSDVRAHCGERAALRCIHFFAENERVEKQFKALKQERFTEFLALVQQSGDSSMKYLQNIYPASNPRNQSVTLALALTDRFLSRHGAGAFRVHGGGFAGTIQAYIPSQVTPLYRRTMQALFGKSSVQTLVLRPIGVASLML